MITKGDIESVSIIIPDIDLELAAYVTKDFNRDEWESKWLSSGDDYEKEYKRLFEEGSDPPFFMSPDKQLHLDKMFLFIPLVNKLTIDK
jgi:hypothetical protein